MTLDKSSSSWRARLSIPLDIALEFGLVFGALVFAIIVGPHPMYYAPVAALGALLAGRVCAGARSSIPRAVFAALLIISLLPAIPAFARYHWLFKQSINPEHWVGVQAHRSAVHISRILAQRGVWARCDALSDGRAGRESSPSGIRRRTVSGGADAYAAERVAQLHGVGPATLDALFASSPPGAIVAGFGPFRFNGMDAALIDYARRSGYVIVSDDWTVTGYKNGQVWVRPER